MHEAEPPSEVQEKIYNFLRLGFKYRNRKGSGGHTVTLTN